MTPNEECLWNVGSSPSRPASAQPEVHSPDSRRSPASFHTRESRGAVVMATGRWGRSQRKEEAEELQVVAVPKRQDVRANRSLAEKKKQTRGRERAPLWFPFKEHKAWPARLTFLCDPPTSSTAGRLSIIDRKSRPGRKALGRDGRKVSQRCRKPRGKSCERVEGGRCPLVRAKAVLSRLSCRSPDPNPKLGLRRPCPSVVPARPDTATELGWGRSGSVRKIWLLVCRLGGEAQLREKEFSVTEEKTHPNTPFSVKGERVRHGRQFFHICVKELGLAEVPFLGSLGPFFLHLPPDSLFFFLREYQPLTLAS